MEIYILSTGRAGTTLMHRIFSEAFPPLKLSHQTKWSRCLNILGNLSVSDETLYKVFVALKKQKTPAGTVDPLLSMPIAKIINHKQPDKAQHKIIHLVRDPRTFVTSFMNWKNISVRKRILHYIVPFWQPSPVFGNNVSLRQRFLFNKFKHFCYIWSYKNSFFYNSFSKQDNYLLLRMEDLIDPLQCEKQINDLFHFLNIPPDPELDLLKYTKTKINPSREKSFPDYEFWSDSQKQYLEKTCGSLMRVFGYHCKEMTDPLSANKTAK